MTELLQLAFSPQHLFYSLLLIALMIYWVTVFMGALDLNFLHFDTDHDADGHLETSGDHAPGFLLETLAFFNLGKVPFMVFATFLVFFMWAGSLLGEQLLGHIGLFFLIWLVPNLVVGLFLTKALTGPFKSAFARMNAGGKTKKDLVGKIGTVVTRIAPGRIGSIDIQTEDGHFLLNAAPEGDAAIEKGARALIVEFDTEKDLYLVTPFDLPTD